MTGERPDRVALVTGASAGIGCACADRLAGAGWVVAMTTSPQRPTRAEQQAAVGRTIPDVIAPGLRVLFSGINPGLYSAATGCHFARPGNRFWPALHASGFTSRLLHPWEQEQLLDLGLGITNLVARSTARADELEAGELKAGGQVLAAKVAELRPRWLAVVGVTAYRTAFGQPGAVVGEQGNPIGETRVWLLPNPSGLNAHWTASSLAEAFGKLREAVGEHQAAFAPSRSSSSDVVPPLR